MVQFWYQIPLCFRTFHCLVCIPLGFCSSHCLVRIISLPWTASRRRSRLLASPAQADAAPSAAASEGAAVWAAAGPPPPPPADRCPRGRRRRARGAACWPERRRQRPRPTRPEGASPGPSGGAGGMSVAAGAIWRCRRDVSWRWSHLAVQEGCQSPLEPSGGAGGMSVGAGICLLASTVILQSSTGTVLA